MYLPYREKTLNQWVCCYPYLLLWVCWSTQFAETRTKVRTKRWVNWNKRKARSKYELAFIKHSSSHFQAWNMPATGSEEYSKRKRMSALFDYYLCVTYLWSNHDRYHKHRRTILVWFASTLLHAFSLKFVCCNVSTHQDCSTKRRKDRTFKSFSVIWFDHIIRHISLFYCYIGFSNLL